MHTGSKVARAAVVSDARGGSYFEGLMTMSFEDLRTSGIRHRVLFLEADERDTADALQGDAAPPSPGPDRQRRVEGSRVSATSLAPLRARADVVIDTTGLTAAMLRRKLADELLPTHTPGRLAVTFQSFGFKNGPARDPDLLFDVRFLPNPHYEADLRPLTGDDRADRRLHRPRG